MKDEEPILLVKTTAPALEKAEFLAREMIDRRFAACATLQPAARSIYRWKGKVEHAEEVVVTFKTTGRCLDALREALVHDHPYETPEVLVLHVDDGSPAYLDWIRSECTGGLSTK